MTAEDVKRIMDAASEVVLNDADEIAHLAKLPPLEYERERKKAAERLSIERISTLDAIVEGRREKPQATQGQGRALSLPELEPWHEPVDGATLLEELVAAILRYVIMDTKAADAVALWVIHTHIFDIFDVTPRLGITSPEKQCGKTTLLDVLQCLVRRALLAANVSASVVFRTIEMVRPTLLIDEADTFLHENQELRGALNSGHRCNGEFIRNVSDAHEPRLFSTFAPVAIALIGKLPDTLEDRSILISLHRRKQNELVTQFRADRTDELNRLARMTARWAQDTSAKLAGADPAMPEGLFNRLADNWRPLLAIADIVGGDWPGRARNAAIALSAGGDTEQSSLRTQLLADIRDIFKEQQADRLPSSDLAQALANMEERPWGDWHGKAITPNVLARQLQHFRIRPGNAKFDGKTLKGYERRQFEEHWSRYLPGDAPPATATSLPTPESQELQPVSRPLPEHNGSVLKITQNASISATGSGVAAQNTPAWEIEV